MSKQQTPPKTHPQKKIAYKHNSRSESAKCSGKRQERLALETNHFKTATYTVHDVRPAPSTKSPTFAV